MKKLFQRDVFPLRLKSPPGWQTRWKRHNIQTKELNVTIGSLACDTGTGTVGIQPGLVVANLVIPPDQVAPFAQARRNMQVKYLAEIRQRFNTSVLEIPLLPHEVKGLDMLKELGQLVYGQEKIGVR